MTGKGPLPGMRHADQLAEVTAMHYLLFCDVTEDYAERRQPWRATHLEHAQAAVARREPATRVPAPVNAGYVTCGSP